jgi:hypothetical protein
MVCNIEAASFEDNGNRVNDTVGFSLAFRAYSYRFLIEPLFPFKMMVAFTALILIDGHYFTSRLSLLYETVLLRLVNWIGARLAALLISKGRRWY